MVDNVRINVQVELAAQQVRYLDTGRVVVNAAVWVDPELSPSPAAVEKAAAWLVSNLNPEQRRSHMRDGFFLVTGSKGNLYKIVTKGGASGNVFWVLPEGMVVGRFCGYPGSRGHDGKRIPKEDQILGQMMQLVTDEDSFLTTAMLQSGTRPPTWPLHKPPSKPAQTCTCDTCELAFRLFAQLT